MGSNIGVGFSHTRYASSADLEKLGNLGEIYRVNGIPYKFVQVHTTCLADVIAAGHVLYNTATANVVSNVIAQGVSNSANNYAGIAPADLSASVPESTSTLTYYMLMQVGGRHSAVVTNGDDDIAAGDLIIASTTDAACDSAATPNTANFIGVAAAADVDASNTVAVNMRFCG